MKDNKVNDKEIGRRVKEIREHLSLTQEAFGVKIGINDKSTVSKIEKGILPLPAKAKVELYSTMGIDKNWLERGIDSAPTDIPDSDEVVVPVYSDRGALATPNTNGINDQSSIPTEYRKLARSLFDDAQAILPVYGNSMTPAYPPSTELALALDESGYIEYGEVYVLELHGSDIPLFKRVLKSAVPGQVILASDNEMIRETGPFRGDYFYPPQPIDIDKVRNWWVVLGDQKRRKNKQIILRNLREQNS